MMRFIVNQRVFQEFPGTRIGVVHATDVTNKDGQEAYLVLQKEVAQLKKLLTAQTLAHHPFIHAWQLAYKKMGLNPKKYLSSVENLANRVLKGQELRSINPMVDLYNAISLKYLLPLGGENLDMMRGDLHLRFAMGDEKPAQLLGQKEPYKSELGEVFYADDEGAVCVRWNWREATRTLLTPETRNALLIIDALEIVPETILTSAINELAHLIQKHCKGNVSVAIVDQKNPEIVLKKDHKYVALNKPGAVTPDAQSIMDFMDILAQAKEEISAETKNRIDKVEKLRQMGIEPWPETKPVPNTAAQVLAEFEKPEQQKNYTIAGRLLTIRLHGKTAFATLQDRTNKIQIYLKQDVLGDKTFDLFQQFIDIGDIIWLTGVPFKTKTGEITLEVTQFALVSKCLHPLPEKFHGLADVEIRYRQRYLDLISNAESRERFAKRSKIIRLIRNYFDSHGFMEVETPMLHPIPGGAEARPFITYHNALNMDLYLRIAPELYLKKLVIGGFEAVYELNRCFRNEGISTKHNPEFTTIEFYIAHHNYEWMAHLVEDVMKTIVKEVSSSMQVQYGERIIDFAAPFKMMSMQNAIIQYIGCTENDLKENNIDKLLKNKNIILEKKDASWGEKFYALFDKLVEPQLIQPTFITHFPVEISPLAKRDPNNPKLVNRFELFISGMELSNGFNELNDPFDQAARFTEQAKARAAGSEEAHYYDADFVQALEYGLPPTVGAAIGIDRFVMLLTNTTSIKDVILFPTLKKKADKKDIIKSSGDDTQRTSAETKLLYLADLKSTECDAKVLEILSREDSKNIIILDQTIFYPQGGGQPCDQGTITSSSAKFIVEDVRKVDGVVQHIGHFEKGKFSKDDTVHCIVDKERRLLNTRLYSAGHIVDIALVELGINWKPGKGYHFPEGPYVEYEGSLENVDKEDLQRKLESISNKIVEEGRKTDLSFLSQKDAEAMGVSFPANLPSGTQVRVVKYGEHGISCGGTHVTNTEQIGKMVIRKISQKAGTIRVSYDIVK